MFSRCQLLLLLFIHATDNNIWLSNNMSGTLLDAGNKIQRELDPVATLRECYQAARASCSVNRRCDRHHEEGGASVVWEHLNCP